MRLLNLAVLSVALLIPAGCSKHSGDDPSHVENMLPGKWKSGCAPGAGNTYRLTEMDLSDDGALSATIRVHREATCETQDLMRYNLAGRYGTHRVETVEGRPVLFDAELKKVTVIFQDPELVKEANRPPGLYGVTTWTLGTETPIEERLPSGFLAGIAPEVLPLGQRLRAEGTSLLVGEVGFTRFTPVR